MNTVFAKKEEEEEERTITSIIYLVRTVIKYYGNNKSNVEQGVVFISRVEATLGLGGANAPLKKC